MVSTMPGCVRKHRVRNAGWPAVLLSVAVALLSLPACSQQSGGGSFEINKLDARWANGHVDVSVEQQIQLSQEARRALRHGVPLTLEVELVLRDARTQTRDAPPPRQVHPCWSHAGNPRRRTARAGAVCLVSTS